MDNRARLLRGTPGGIGDGFESLEARKESAADRGSVSGEKEGAVKDHAERRRYQSKADETKPGRKHTELTCHAR